MDDSILLPCVAALVALYVLVCIVQLVAWLWCKSHTEKGEESDEDYMECPYCKEIALPVNGGECNECHRECWI